MKNFRNLAPSLVFCCHLLSSCDKSNRFGQASTTVPLRDDTSILEGTKSSKAKLLDDDVVEFCLEDASKDPQVTKWGRVDGSDRYFYHNILEDRTILEFTFEAVKGLRVAYVFENGSRAPAYKIIYSAG